ncbi:DUF58 domain-containing protein [Vibrio sp. OPT20]|uniref:DUF58 domain-containing protein n=1 Tax=Vibrio sp. OPT20 TaxID=2778642 RepID=UPI001882030E|nr:DUF58 domain-containing protein [Vibrio sp. OPT20]MBE8565248.1 DUF58 domain-containing protein [Vibrio sp. OPT20]
MTVDLRIYPTSGRLAELTLLGRKISWQPPYQKLTPLTGKHRSQQRGRGLDFVELRHYYAGDDVRCIDWKVTQRTGQPYLRVYAEENDKNIALLIDLRTRMFFASDGHMKSAIACEAAAIAAGAACHHGDRVGAVILTDSDIVTLPFRRGEKALMALLSAIIEQSNKLPNWIVSKKAPNLEDALKHLVDLGLKESQCFIFSDFSDYDQRNSSVMIDKLARQNSLVGIRITDPLEEQFPKQNLVMGNESYQVELKKSDQSTRERYEHYVQEQKQSLSEHFMRHRLALLDMSTQHDAWTQLLSLTKQ